MTVTLELKPETQRRIEFKAKENGVAVEAYLEEFIEENIGPGATEVEPVVDEETRKKEWLDRFHEWLDSHKDRGGPFLSDEALRRENMYED